MGWLSRYLTTENTRRLLIEAGYRYHMDDLSDDEPFWDHHDNQPIIVMPYQVDNNDIKMWSDRAHSPDDWLKYAIDNFDWMLREGQHEVNMMSIGLHLRVIGRPGRIWALERFLEHVASARERANGPWIATRLDIAEHFASEIPFGSQPSSESQ